MSHKIPWLSNWDFWESTPGVSSATNHQQGVLRSWQLESQLLLAAHALLWVWHYIVEGNELNFIDIVPWRECLPNERAHLDTFVRLRLEPSIWGGADKVFLWTVSHKMFSWNFHMFSFFLLYFEVKYTIL